MSSNEQYNHHSSPMNTGVQSGTPQPKTKSLWERRPQELGDEPPPIYPAEAREMQGDIPRRQQQQQQQQQQQYGGGGGVPVNGQGYQQGHSGGGQAQIVYVQDRRQQREQDVAVGVCAGCATACCCCGCLIM